MATYTLIDKDNPANIARTSEDPRRTEHVHAWFYRGGKCFNQCIVPSRYLLSEFVFQEVKSGHAKNPKHRGRKVVCNGKPVAS